MPDMVRKRSVLIAGHATSISLEAEFWDGLKDIADRRGLSLNALVAEVDGQRQGNLSSALRLLVLRDLKDRCAATAPSLSAQQAL
ncbi:hypothetical protein GALL_117250 [mine drainage metagenome]|uniref:Ribbon-helix-helix domain-containing protein n=1 Tax=mine drainage metagenome TaxID=410659 RepID=A0A1J5SXC9_9ZZZZ